jgi:tRNA U34 2-thiouridine synthase MnmA/TrmU/NifU-like protein involved in Fe-S cluster formation
MTVAVSKAADGVLKLSCRSPYTRRSMSVEAFAQHMERPVMRGHMPAEACTGAAGGAQCGDLIRVSVAVDRNSPDGLIADAGFDASGCGAAIAAGSATTELVHGASLLQAARVDAAQIAAKLGGLSPAKHHAAELAADALHRALGWAARTQAMLAPSPSRTLVAMSGGVDSAVAALLVAEAGQETVAVTLELWSDPENDGERSCCSAQAVRSAREIAHGMGMAHLSIDLREEFRAGVVDGWLEGYVAGLTPNPCVRCNGSVRLDAMLDLADRLGAQTLATGHYARVWGADESSGDGAARREETTSLESAARVGGEATLFESAAGVGGEATSFASAAEVGSEASSLASAAQGDEATSLAGAVITGGGPLLRMAVDESKDQSYALAALSPRSLARLRFPLGCLRKPEVRERASRAGLEVARRPDSQDLCFLAGTSSADFLARHGGLERRTGAIVDRDGRELGLHGGVHTVTVGQRRGLGIGGGEPLYVIATDAQANTVTVGSREQLRTDKVSVREVTLHRDGACVDHVKVRYRGQRLPCRIEGSPRTGAHEHLELRMLEQIERTAPGQVACLYAGDVIVGYGTIARGVDASPGA